MPCKKEKILAPLAFSLGKVYTVGDAPLRGMLRLGTKLYIKVIFVAQVTLITVGTLKESYLVEATAEYKKRLSTLARFEEIS